DRNYAAIVEKAVAWAKSAKGDELKDSDWLAVKLSTAKALKEVAAASTKKDSKTASQLRDARQLATDVAKSPNTEFQAPAQELLAALGPGDAGSSTVAGNADLKGTGNKSQGGTTRAGNSGTVENTAVKTGEGDVPAEATAFDAAYEKASDAATEIETAQAELGFAQQDKPQDAEKIKQLNAKLEAKRGEAFDRCREAVALATDKSDAEKLNFIRYLLCYFHYSKANYYDSALLGEFLVKRYPDSHWARPASKVALVAFNALYNQNKQAGDADLSFESAHIVDLADDVIRQWPDQPEAATALEMLISFNVEGDNFAKAATALSRLPADSPSRGEAEIRFGRALWSKYVRGSQQLREQQAAAAKGEQTPSPLDEATAKQNLDALQKQARESLEHGIGIARKTKLINDRTVLGALALIQLYANASDDNAALALLEDPTLGPLTLLKKENPATKVEGVPEEIYKSALRAYIGAEPQQLDKAAAMMDALEKLYTGDSAASARLTQLLVNVAYELQQQLDDLNRRGETDKASHVIKAFDKFLSRIPAQTANADFKTLNWVASTYENLAAGVNATGSAGTGGKATSEKPPAKLSTDAEQYVRMALKAYDQIFAKAKDDPNFIPADKLVGVKLRMAMANRSVGEFDKATTTFSEILKDKPNLLPAQIEAARTYQLRGAAEKPDYYVAAIKGGRGPDESIWGWGQIAIKTMRNPKYRD
ncbi:MAG TPA: hypothetical protein VGJ15_08420, partial [Pirellulales bacterium]